MNVAFFDIFGFLGFLILAIMSILLLRSKEKLNWPVWVILIIAIAGLIVDAVIVLTTYII